MNNTTPSALTLQEGYAAALDLYRRGELRAALAVCLGLMPAGQSDSALRALMGALELGLNNTARAVAHYTAVTQLEPHSAEAWYSLAVALHRAERLAEARANYEHALRLNANHPAAIENLGAVCQQLGDFARARDYFKRALELRPRNAACHWNLALSYDKLNERALELQHLRRAVELDPNQPEWNLRYASRLRAVDLAQAEQQCHQLLSQLPDDIEAWNLLGCIQLAQRRLDDARNSFERVIGLAPQHAHAHYNLGCVLLMQEDYAAGWREFAWRRQRPDFANGTTAPPTNVPEWRGEPIANKHVLLKCEQGLGDTIMFARFAATLTQAGAHVTLECPPKMAPLLRLVTGVGRTVEQHQPDAQIYDYYAWLLDLPRVLNMTNHTAVRPPPYLRIEEARAARWRKRLPDSNVLRVGLVWRGNPNNPLDAHRSVSPDLFSALRTVDNAEFVVLQKDAAPNEIAMLRRNLKLRMIDDPVDEDGKFLDTAAILTRLDVLITVDTATAHVAGALGMPVWLLVAEQQDWRWGVSAATTMWYPTMTLYRQTQASWTNAAAQLREDVARLALGNMPPPASQPLPPAPNAASQAQHDQALEQGLQALRAGDLKRAEACMATIPATHPQYAAVLNYRAVAALQSGATAQALQWLEEAVARAPQLADARVNLARVLQEHGQLAAALVHYRAALSAAPDHAVAHANLGSLYHEQRRLDEAIAHYQRACQAAPDFAVPYNNLGLIALEQGRYDEALQLFERALRLDPRFADAWCNLGNFFRSSARIDKARNAYDMALTHDPSHAGAHWNRALLSLLQGNYAQAWPDYAWGYAARERKLQTFPIPSWREGETLAGKSVLVFPEEGVGDEVFYARFIPTLLTQCRRLVVECDPRLQPMLKRNFPSADIRGVHRQDAPSRVRAYGTLDMAIGAIDLCQALRIAAPVAPAARSYIAPNPAVVAQWREQLRALPAGRRIGIAWRGGKDPQLQRERSIPLQDWQDILAIPNITWINLQYGDHAAEIDATQRALGMTLHSLPGLDPLRDLDGYAALLTCLDLVVSIDNSTVHFAGALGVPTYVLLPLSPEWRWGLHGDTSVWYPSLRLFRQQQLHNWDTVKRRVFEALSDNARTDAALRTTA